MSSSSQVLEPTLTKFDQRVLAAVEGAHALRQRATPYWIAEILNIEPAAFAEFYLTLKGLQHLDYLSSSRASTRKPRHYVITEKGREVIATSARTNAPSRARAIG